MKRQVSRESSPAPLAQFLPVVEQARGALVSFDGGRGWREAGRWCRGLLPLPTHASFPTAGLCGGAPRAGPPGAVGLLQL